MRFILHVIFHFIVTAIGVLMIIFGALNNNTPLLVWGIIVVILGNLAVYFLIFLIALLMIPAARKQDSLVGINEQKIQNRVKYCKQCGKEVPYTIMICPNCGNKTYTEEKPKEIKVENNDNN